MTDKLIKIDNRRRSIVKRFRLNDEENAYLYERMGKAHAPSFQYYARKMCLDGKVMRVDYSDIRELTREVNRIGVNINQIAHVVNTTGNFYLQDLEQLKNEHDELCRFIRNSIREHLRTIKLEEDI